MTDTRESEQFAAALGRIRSMHRWLAGILIGYVPAIILLYVMQLPEWAIITCAVCLLSLGIVIGFMIGASRCPACCRLFHVRGGSGNIFMKKCIHCGIQLK